MTLALPSPVSVSLKPEPVTFSKPETVSVQAGVITFRGIATSDGNRRAGQAEAPARGGQPRSFQKTRYHLSGLRGGFGGFFRL